MNHRPFKAWPVGCAIALALAAQAADPFIDLKPGLWEFSSTGGVTGQIPDAMLQGVPPAQREAMKAHMLAAFGVAEHIPAIRSCITHEQLIKGPESASTGCTVESRKVTADQFLLAESCTNPRGKSTVKLDFQRVGREQFDGSVTVVLAMGGQPMTIQRSFSGKWLGADCGAVHGQWTLQ